MCEATRGTIRQWQPGERACGETRELTVGNAGRAGRCGMRETADASETRRLGGVAVEEMRGNPEIHRLRTPKEPKDEGFEAPRSSIAGTAERCRTRGNSRTHWETEREDV